ncbi:hypothetical protein LTR85_003382 [Meristemomyces frigidus]|nr:hypothetical protein LTR85_003382 [Meristemomyces frigidus]
MTIPDDKPTTYESLRLPGYYGYLVVAGLYQTSRKLPSPLSTAYFLPALKHCIDTHPILSAAIQGADTESPQFVRPSHLHLKRHVRVVDVRESADEEKVIRNAIVECHDRFTHGGDLIPPWDVTVMPLPRHPKSDGTKLCVLFSYSHSHGDGTAGLSFHHSFLRGLRQHAGTAQTDGASAYEPPDYPLLPAFATAVNLKISWSYLLGALFADRLPTFLRTALGLPSLSAVTEDTWLGRPITHDPAHHHTGLETLVLANADVKGLLSACRAHDVRLTGLLHQLIVRVLSQSLPECCKIDGPAPPAYDIVATTPLSIRHLAPGWASVTDMVMAVSATQELFPAGVNAAISDSADDALWSGSRETGAKLAAASSTLTDQPIGLLRYVSDVRSWLTDQLGNPRDCSYELSNIMMFDPEEAGPQEVAAELTGGGWEVGNMYFSQPANVVGPPLTFSVVSRKGGALVVCLSWQVGVLGVKDESAFATEVLASVESQIAEMIRGKGY